MRRLTLLLALTALACSPSPAPSAPSASPDPLPVAPVSASAAPTAPAPTSDASAPSTDASAPTIGKKNILVVSFISPGDGTDHAAYDRLQASLKTLASVPPFVSHRWGREGEHDECFDLAALSAADRKAFVARVKEAIRASKKVTITEDGTCQEGR